MYRMVWYVATCIKCVPSYIANSLIVSEVERTTYCPGTLAENYNSSNVTNHFHITRNDKGRRIVLLKITKSNGELDENYFWQMKHQ